MEEFSFTHFMTLLFHVNRYFGFSQFRKGYWFFLDIGHFISILLWFVSCSISRLDFTRIAIQSCSIRAVFIHIALNAYKFTHTHIPLCYLIAFYIAYKKTNVSRIFTLSSQICKVNSNFIIFLHSQRFQIFFLCLPWLLSQFISPLILIWTRLSSGRGKTTFHEYSCNITAEIMFSNLNVQFYCWTLFFRFSFQQLLKKESRKIARLKQNTLELLPSNNERLHEAISQLKMILELKQEIQKLYGSFIFINQLNSFIYFLHYFVGFLFLENMKLQLYFLTGCLYYLMTSYMPHWMGQATLNEVS